MELLLKLEHTLHPGQVHPQLGGHLLDAPQPLHVLMRVQAGPLGRALGLDQAARLVHPERLRMHVRELRRDRDHEHAPVGGDIDPPGRDPGSPGGHQRSAPFVNRPERGLPFITFESRSMASSCSGESEAGTSITNR